MIEPVDPSRRRPPSNSLESKAQRRRRLAQEWEVNQQLRAQELAELEHKLEGRTAAIQMEIVTALGKHAMHDIADVVDEQRAVAGQDVVLNRLLLEVTANTSRKVIRIQNQVFEPFKDLG